jgi:hypothetical protein
MTSSAVTKLSPQAHILNYAGIGQTLEKLREKHVEIEF